LSRKMVETRDVPKIGGNHRKKLTIDLKGRAKRGPSKNKGSKKPTKDIIKKDSTSPAQR